MSSAHVNLEGLVFLVCSISPGSYIYSASSSGAGEVPVVWVVGFDGDVPFRAMHSKSLTLCILYVYLLLQEKVPLVIAEQGIKYSIVSLGVILSLTHYRFLDE